MILQLTRGSGLIYLCFMMSGGDDSHFVGTYEKDGDRDGDRSHLWNAGR